MKKLMCLIIVSIMCFCCLFGCNDSDISSTPQPPQTPQPPPVSQEIDVSSISLSKTSITMTVGDKTPISVTVNPSNATNKNVIWSSSNSSVAEYINGEIYALGEGTCLITAKAGNKNSTCMVTVEKKKVYVEKIEFDSPEYTLVTNTTTELVLSFTPTQPDDLLGSVTIDDTNIADVSYDAGYNIQDGNYIKVIVKTKKPGSSKIIVTLKNGVTCSTEIIVVDPLSNFDIIVDILGDDEIKLADMWGESFKLNVSTNDNLKAYYSASYTTNTGTYSSNTKYLTYILYISEKGEGSGYCIYSNATMSKSGNSIVTNRYSATVHFEITFNNIGENTNYNLKITNTQCTDNAYPVSSNSCLTYCKEYMYDFTDVLAESFIIIIDELI